RSDRDWISDVCTSDLASADGWQGAGSRRACALPPVGSGVRLIRNEQPHGFCQASDTALCAVRTKYALLVDADILFPPGDFAGARSEERRVGEERDGGW